MKKAPDDAGAFVKQAEIARSVPRDHRATAPVEAVDQLAADRLDIFLGVLEAERGRSGCRDQADGRLLGLISGETILRLPVEARQQVERVFVAGAEEPA